MPTRRPFEPVALPGRRLHRLRAAVGGVERLEGARAAACRRPGAEGARAHQPHRGRGRVDRRRARRVLVTGADSLDTVAAYIGMLGMPFTVESPCRTEIAPRAARRRLCPRRRRGAGGAVTGRVMGRRRSAVLSRVGVSRAAPGLVARAARTGRVAAATLAAREGRVGEQPGGPRLDERAEQPPHRLGRQPQRDQHRRRRPRSAARARSARDRAARPDSRNG